MAFKGRFSGDQVNQTTPIADRRMQLLWETRFRSPAVAKQDFVVARRQPPGAP